MRTATAQATILRALASLAGTLPTVAPATPASTPKPATRKAPKAPATRAPKAPSTPSAPLPIVAETYNVAEQGTPVIGTLTLTSFRQPKTVEGSGKYAGVYEYQRAMNDGSVERGAVQVEISGRQRDSLRAGKWIGAFSPKARTTHVITLR